MQNNNVSQKCCFDNFNKKLMDKKISILLYFNVTVEKYQENNLS